MDDYLYDYPSPDADLEDEHDYHGGYPDIPDSAGSHYPPIRTEPIVYGGYLSDSSRRRNDGDEADDYEAGTGNIIDPFDEDRPQRESEDDSSEDQEYINETDSDASSEYEFEEEEEEDNEVLDRRVLEEGELRYGQMATPSTEKQKGVRGRKRGPRKAAEPNPEIKVMLAEANSAFIAEEYIRAEEISQQVLLKNNEIFAAYLLLSEIQAVRGDYEGSSLTLIMGAHLKPKDSEIWRTCAERTLQESIQPRPVEIIKQAIYCLSRVIDINAKDFEARFERVALYEEMGRYKFATAEYTKILHALPHDTTILRHLAKASIKASSVPKALASYRDTIEHYRKGGWREDAGFDWSDVNVFAELSTHTEQFEDGLREVKAISRWLLGRESESFWDSYTADDREWDLLDTPRRQEVAEFSRGQFGENTYGAGLPLELRIKMGIFRLNMGIAHFEEALQHFAWLDPADCSEGAKVNDFPDLFKEVAEALLKANCPQNALTFFEPIQYLDGHADISVYMNMGKCYASAKLYAEAEQCFLAVIEHEERNIDARVLLARMFQEIGQPEKGFKYAHDAMALGRRSKEDDKVLQAAIADTESAHKGLFKFYKKQPKRKGIRHSRVRSKVQSHGTEKERTDNIQLLYMSLQGHTSGMRQGAADAVRNWMEIADAMQADFRNNSSLCPNDRNVRFLGYSAAARRRANKGDRGLDSNDAPVDMETLLTRAENGDFDEPIPTTYRDISFDVWLDIFLDYAICLTKQGHQQRAYKYLNDIIEMSIFYNSSIFMFRIQVCFTACALYVKDEEQCCKVARWFVREYSGNDQVYQFYNALARMCQKPPSWYHCQPSQKWLLRQVRARDDLVKRNTGSEDDRKLSTSLLMLYGHVLYTGRSSTAAMNYFYRAHAVEPFNPMVNLCLALTYVHYGLKRQSDNRHFNIMQGLVFLEKYKSVRAKEDSPLAHRLEADYNIGRFYHLLGLNHLATQHYEKVLQIKESSKALDDEGQLTGYEKDAAFNLRSIYAVSGNTAMARKITAKWLFA